MDPQAEVRQIAAAEGDRTGRAQPVHLWGVDRGDRLGQGRDRLRGRGARQVDVLLDRERDAVQRAEPGAVRHRPVGRVGGREGLVRQETDERVEVRVDRLDPVQVRLRDLAAADLAIADQGRQLDSALAPQFALPSSPQTEIEATVRHRADSGKAGATWYQGCRRCLCWGGLPDPGRRWPRVRNLGAEVPGQGFTLGLAT